ncbi:TPA: hypothetical protein ACQ8GA_005497 [Escherichia coli]
MAESTVTADSKLTSSDTRRRICNFAFFSGLISAQFWAGRAQPKSPELGANLLVMFGVSLSATNNRRTHNRSIKCMM